MRIVSLCLAAVLLATFGLVMSLPASATDADPAERFQRVNAELQELMERAQRARQAYAEADAAEREALAERFNALVDEINELLPELTAATLAAYAAAPNEDMEVSATVAMVTQSLLGADRYEEAHVAAELMVEHRHPEDARYAMAGMAAFAVGEFDAAAAHFAQAEAVGVMPQHVRRFASEVEAYQAYAEREQTLREAEAEADDLPRVRMVTSEGELVIELYEDQAPIAVANFITLVEDGFYDGVIFHRVLPGFMAQGGCPEGTGTGGPGYTIPCEVEGDYRRHFRGTLSMAHAGRDTGGSQFFITFLPTPHLNGRHTAFGRVIEGIEILAELQRIDPQRPQPGVEPSRIVEASVIRKRDHDYSFETSSGTR